MARTRFPADFGLSSRMLLTMFLLGLLYVVFVAVLVAVLGTQYLPLVLLIAGGFLFFQYFFSDRIALYAMRGHEVSPRQAPELHQMIDRLCALADMPKPRVAISDSDVPNAFATGRDQKHAVVCVTTGILRRLSEPELEAVLSHELSHVAHRDVAVMTLASFLGILAGFVVRAAIYGGAYGGFGGYGRSNDNRDNTGAVILLVVLASAVVYALSFLLTRLLSRYRELSADRADFVSGLFARKRPIGMDARPAGTDTMERMPGMSRATRTAQVPWRANQVREFSRSLRESRSHLP